MPDYRKVITMVERSKDQKLRLRNSEARNERIETRAVVTSRKRSSGVERGKIVFYSGKQKNSVREETSVFSGTMRISVQHRHQKPLHQHQEVEVRRE